jgi:hypothetical protein
MSPSLRIIYIGIEFKVFTLATATGNSHCCTCLDHLGDVTKIETILSSVAPPACPCRRRYHAIFCQCKYGFIMPSVITEFLRQEILIKGKKEKHIRGSLCINHRYRLIDLFTFSVFAKHAILMRVKHNFRI